MPAMHFGEKRIFIDSETAYKWPDHRKTLVVPINGTWTLNDSKKEEIKERFDYSFHNDYIDDRYWRASEMKIENLRSEKKEGRTAILGTVSWEDSERPV